MKDPIACLTLPGTIHVGPSEREKLTYTAQCSTDPAQAPIYNCVCIHVYVQPRGPQASPFPNDFQASRQRGRQHVPHCLVFTGRGNVDGFIHVLLLGILAVVWAVYAADRLCPASGNLLRHWMLVFSLRMQKQVFKEAIAAGGISTGTAVFLTLHPHLKHGKRIYFQCSSSCPKRCRCTYIFLLEQAEWGKYCIMMSDLA